MNIDVSVTKKNITAEAEGKGTIQLGFQTPQAQTWAQVLVRGNVSGGKNPFLSDGDELQGNNVIIRAVGASNIAGLFSYGNIWYAFNKDGNTFWRMQLIPGGIKSFNLGDIDVIGNGCQLGMVDNDNIAYLFNAALNLNVGINEANPTCALHVKGSARIVDGTEGVNKVLTSDASGNASWQDITSIVVDLTPVYDAIQVLADALAAEITRAEAAEADLQNQINSIAGVDYTKFVFNEIPTGAIDGINISFNTANDYLTGTLQIFYNGLLLRPGLDFTEDGSNKYSLTFAPDAGSDIYHHYIKS